MNLIKPPKLLVGSKLGIIAPGSPVTVEVETIDRGYKRLRAKGFEPIEAKQCRVISGHTAGTVQERIDAIHGFLKDPKIGAIMAFWGGFQSHQLLDHLDWDLLRRYPKIIVGYSDVTALSVGIYSKTGLVGFSGPCVISFAKPELPSYTWDSFARILMDGALDVSFSSSQEYSDNPWFRETPPTMKWETNGGWSVFNAGRARGRLVGGNLGTLLLLAGTPYWPDLANAILFVEEDEEETPERINRMFTQLRQMGVFRQISGLLVGRFPRSVGFSEKDTFTDILRENLTGSKIPVMYNVDFGHTDPILTLPIGIQAEIDTPSRSIKVVETAVL